MRYAQVPVYKFSELSQQAKEEAKYNHASTFSFFDEKEVINTLEALTRHFGASIRTYEIDWSGGCSPSWAEFDAPEIKEDELEALVKSLGDGSGNCVLTGVGYDEDAIDGVRKAYRNGERNVEKLLEEGFRTLVAAAHAEYAAYYEDENFAEIADNNDWEFTKEGKRFRS